MTRIQAVPTAEEVAQLPPMLTAAEVAAIFRVEPAAVQRWGRDGRLRSVRLPNGRRRYFRVDVQALLSGEAATS